MKDSRTNENEVFWAAEFWHSLGWTPCGALSLTRQKAREDLDKWRRKCRGWRFRIVKYQRVA